MYVRCCHSQRKDEKLIVCLYVNELIVTSSSEELISNFKHQMLNEFEMIDLGRLSYFLIIEFTETNVL